MKFTILPHTLRSVFALSLSACILGSAFSLEPLQQGLHENISARSLPGSLAFASEEAVWPYQPQPEPVQPEPSAAAVPENSDFPITSVASDSESADNQETSSTSEQSLEPMGSQGDLDESHGHIPSVSEMNAMMMAATMETASASGNIVHLFSSLLASISVSLLLV